MIPGDVMALASWIEAECDRLTVNESDRYWCRELHGKIRAAQGDDADVQRAVTEFLRTRYHAA